MVSNHVVARRMSSRQDQEYERYYSQAARKKMPASDFAGPHMSFPIRTQQDVYNAARLIGHADNPEAVKRRIIAIAKRKGFQIPDAWQKKDDGKPKETLSSRASSSSFHSNRAVLATIKTCWLEDDAISLNGRQYPAEAVDRLVQSAQEALSDPYALPLTCYLSHDKADQDSTLDIAGKLTKVWKEGRKAYAMIDIPNTSTGQDVVTLVQGGFMRSQSLRASGAEMRLNPNRTVPQVGGLGLKLEGIDFTARPGLAQTARITDVQVTESTEPQCISEVFNASPNTMILEDLMSTEIQEEGIEPIAGGNTVGMTNDNPRDDYSSRMYSMPPNAPTDQFPQALSDVHDRLAYVMDMDCGPDTMEAIQRFGTGIVLERKQLEEAGAKLSSSTKAHLMKAHNGVASHLNMPCIGDGDEDADDKPGMGPGFSGAGMSKGEKGDDEMESSGIAATVQEIHKIVQDAVKTASATPAQAQPQPKKEATKMTPEEAARLLAEAGYEIKPPKTKEQLLQEEFEAKLAEQRKQAEEQQAKMAEEFAEIKRMLIERSNPLTFQPQRKSLVEGATIQETPKKPYYRNGDYMREKLRDVSLREQLLDRSCPLPADMNPEHLLKELQLELLGMYDAAYGLTGNPKIFGQ